MEEICEAHIPSGKEALLLVPVVAFVLAWVRTAELLERLGENIRTITEKGKIKL